MSHIKSFIFYFSFIFFFSSIIYNCKASDTIRVACVGNSITEGAGLPGRDTASYPARLQQLLGPAYNVINCGVAGATMLKNGNKPYWTFGITQFRNAMSFLPHIVIIKLGTNDSKSSTSAYNWPPHKEEFIGDYKAMVDTFANLSSKPKVWACYPIPAFSSAYDIDSLVIHYEILPKIKTVVLDKGIPLIDLFALMANQKSLVPDGIHPNAEGYMLIAKKVYSMLMSDTLKITKQKNRLSAPQGYFFYQWYKMNIPIPEASGGREEVIIVKDTGLYKVLVGISQTSDDILVTSPVHVDLNDVSNFVYNFSSEIISSPINTKIKIYSINGQILRELKDSKKFNSSFIKRHQITKKGIYIIKSSNKVEKIFIE